VDLPVVEHWGVKSIPFDQLPVLAVSGDEVFRVAGSATLFEIADLLHDNDVGALVVGHEQVTGIVTERDVVRALAARMDPSAATAADIATAHPIWCDGQATVAEAAQEMADKWVRHLLIEHDGRLVGIVSARDLLGACIDLSAIDHLTDAEGDT
jgi:CBS domain-containing protein